MNTKNLATLKIQMLRFDKIKTSILGPKHKAPEPTCIRQPDTGELVARPEEIKNVSIKHNIKILIKVLEAETLALHDMIMKTDNKDLNKLEYNTCKAVLWLG